MWPYFDIDLFITNVCDSILTGNQPTIVSVMTMLWARQLRNHDSAQGRAIDLFSFPKPPLWLWGPPIGCLGLFLWGVKQLRHVVTTCFCLVPWLRMSRTLSALLFVVYMGTALPVTLLAALYLTESVQFFEVPLKSWYIC